MKKSIKKLFFYTKIINKGINLNRKNIEKDIKMDFKEKFNTVMKYFQVITLIKKFKESNLKKSFNAKENKYIKNNPKIIELQNTFLKMKHLLTNSFIKILSDEHRIIFNNDFLNIDKDRK